MQSLNIGSDRSRIDHPIINQDLVIRGYRNQNIGFFRRRLRHSAHPAC